MKTMKVALLASAALAAVSVSARADDTAAIKAQLEALTARIAELEAAPAAPVGYSLLTISERTATVVPGYDEKSSDRASYGDTATVIGILPAADVPASATIEWSGFVRAAIVYNDQEFYTSDAPDPIVPGAYTLDTFSDDDYDILSRAEIKVVAKTDTSVGEVGVVVKVRANFDGNGNATAEMPDGTWGYWMMTPELALGGGYSGSLGNIGYGYDGACSCYYTDNADVALNPGDVSQMRLGWTSGPLSFAVAVEDASIGDGVVFEDDLGAAAEIKYSGDSFSGEISGVYRDHDEFDFWQVGAGASFALGEWASISAGAALGEKEANFLDDGEIVAALPFQTEWWGASILGRVNLAESIHAELAYGYKDYEADEADWDIHAFMGGIYYEPVAQLTIGLEAEYSIVDLDASFDDGAVIPTTLDGSEEADRLTVDLVTVFRF